MTCIAKKLEKHAHSVSFPPADLVRLTCRASSL
jgi:hypothetical protein